MSAPLSVLLVTDAFPPICGGSGWSTFELARGLVARGHHVEVVKTEAQRRSGIFETTVEGLRVTLFCRRATNMPFLRNVQKNERFWSALEKYLTPRLRAGTYDIIHGQHTMSAVPAIAAGRAAGVPSVATVRDYWPVCYWADLIYDPEQSSLCPECTMTMMTKCVKPRAGVAAAAAWPLIPYMRANLLAKRTSLARAGAIIAPSHQIAKDLAQRAPEIAGTPLYTIPNPVDMMTLDDAFVAAARPTQEPYALYAGKLATNKGVQYLIRAYADAGIPWPLVIVGDGPLRESIEREARERSVKVGFTGWLPRDQSLAWMRHASILAFPSYGPESLSRVLIEASALGVAIAAMDTGGTRDIIHPNITGLLSSDPAGFSADLRRLYEDERLRASLGAQARAHSRATFAAASVVERIEHVYRGLLVPRAA